MIKESLTRQKKYFQTDITKPIEFRIEQLKKLKQVIKKNEKEILDALYQDLRKPEFEAYTNEVGFALNTISYMIKNIKKFSEKKRVKVPFHQIGSKAYYQYEPFGTVCIIGPFNYPFQLLIEPMIGAMAAGNTIILKPSSYTKATEAIIVKMIKSTFDSAYIDVFTGDREVTSDLINSPFDKIFFTGSVGVGKIVMEAAAKNLVPVTLELGGKSPTIVDRTANVDIAAKRIAWGKFINAGQTCIAPDYVYVHQDVEESFYTSLKKYLVEFYGEEADKSPDYGRIVSPKHFDRLVGLIDHHKVLSGGQSNKEDLYIAPTLLKDVNWDDSVMEDEIFGPILPILRYESIEDVIHAIISRPKPLALYLFTENDALEEMVLNRISFGGGAINDTISHVATHLPFGGVGHSGMGAYHGKYSFQEFSHRKSILKKSTKMDIKLVFPPYGKKIKKAKAFLK